MKMGTQTLLKTFLTTLIILSLISHSFASLSTNNRYIVTPSGDRFKLRCINWPGHIHAMIPEGLCKQPLKSIAEKVNGMGFNCVRLTWAVHMYSLEKNKNKTVEQSLDGWNLKDAKAGFQSNNPDLLSMTLADAQKAVIDELGANNVMVVLDNHVSFPMWCCNNYDGNGFFGDEFFDPEEWLTALGTVANRYKGNPTVIGMSMRNELRGPRQDLDTWYKYMQQGAEMIHKNSPEFLVFVSGFNFDTHLEFLKERAFNVSFQNKLVFESHLYSFDDSLDSWKYTTNAFCGNTTRSFFNHSGFLLTGDANKNSYPLFFSEFGRNLKEENEREDYYLSCLLAFMAENDLDWALWALQGSYMIREGSLDLEEYYGMLSKDWGGIRNSTILQKFQLVQQINLEPNSKNPTYNKIFHPKTGMCVQVDNDYYIYGGECINSAKFSYNGDGSAIKLSDGKKCMVAVADGLPVVMSDDCSNKRATWHMISGSKLHIASKDEKGNSLCLEWDYPNSGALLTKKCLCVDNNDNDLPRCEDNPMSQWFSLVPSNIKN